MASMACNGTLQEVLEVHFDVSHRHVAKLNLGSPLATQASGWRIARRCWRLDLHLGERRQLYRRSGPQTDTGELRLAFHRPPFIGRCF
jgi:hypothetical protein